MIKKKCLYCNKEFESDSKIKKYCQFSCCKFAYDLRKAKQVNILPEDEKIKREELLKIYGDRKNGNL